MRCMSEFNVVQELRRAYQIWLDALPAATSNSYELNPGLLGASPLL